LKVVLEFRSFFAYHAAVMLVFLMSDWSDGAQVFSCSVRMCDPEEIPKRFRDWSRGDPESTWQGSRAFSGSSRDLAM